VTPAPKSPAAALRSTGSAALGNSLTGRFLTALFAAYHEERVRYVVLRNYERWPEHFGNDIDLIVHLNDVPLSHAIIRRIADEFGLCWTATRRRTGHILYYLLPTPVDGVEGGILLDFRTDLIHRRFTYLPGPLVLDSRRLGGLFYVPSPAVESLEILLHCLLDARKVRPSYRDRLRELDAGSTNEFREAAERAVGPELARCLAHTLTRGEPEAALRLRRRVALACARHHPATLPVWLRARTGAAWDRLRAWFRPPGHLVALVGPPGFGKPTLSRELCRRFAPTRIRTSTADLEEPAPPVAPRWRAEDHHEDPALQGEAKPIRDGAGCQRLCGLGRNLAASLLRYLVQVRPRLVRGEVVILEGYFEDVDTSLRSLVRRSYVEALLMRLIPEPTRISCPRRRAGADGRRESGGVGRQEAPADGDLPTIVDRMTEQVVRLYTLQRAPGRI